MGNFKRRLDLSSKFLQMGQALQIEGDEKDDDTISLIGTTLVFFGGLALDEDDMYKFSELVALFSAKKTLDELTSMDGPIRDFIYKKANDQTYDDLINRLDEMKNDEEDKEEEDN